MAHQHERLYGRVLVAGSSYWSMIVAFLAVFLITTLLFLGLGSYSRIQMASGVITPERGVADIAPGRTGLLQRIAVSDGQFVQAGQLLATIRTEEDAEGGEPISRQVDRSLALKQAQINAQLGSMDLLFEAQQHELDAERSGLAYEIAELSEQVELQMQLVRSAVNDFDRATGIAARGFMSQKDLDAREDSVLLRRRELSQIEQQLASRRSAIAMLERRSEQLAEQARTQSAAKSLESADIDEQAASYRAQRGFAIRAPLSGTITAVTGRVGQQAKAGSAVMQIIPDRSVLEAELRIASAGMGFVKQGQPVSLAIDAFPYQSFGSLPGKVSSISRSVVLQTGANGAPIPVFIVKVRLERDFVTAFGRQHKLLPGMTLTARIATNRQTIFEWLFEPLYAVGRR